jgi:hypothetical protein
VSSILRCPDLWLQCSMSFIHSLELLVALICTKLMVHCNRSSGNLKTKHTESLFLLWRHLGNWPRGKHKKQTAGSARETWTVAAAADGVRFIPVRWEMGFLLTFKTAPFFCGYPV